jgi:hypothetical protein
MSSVVDCEVKGVNVRARRTCLCVVVDVGASFSIRVSVPYVLLACSCLKRCIVVLGNCEVQSVSAVASVGVRVAVGIITSSGVRLFVPRELLACSLGFCIVGAVVDCEVKSVNVCAGRTCLCVVIYVCASFSVCVSVPYVLFACSCLEC